MTRSVCQSNPYRVLSLCYRKSTSIGQDNVLLVHWDGRKDKITSGSLDTLAPKGVGMVVFVAKGTQKTRFAAVHLAVCGVSRNANAFASSQTTPMFEGTQVVSAPMFLTLNGRRYTCDRRCTSRALCCGHITVSVPLCLRHLASPTSCRSCQPDGDCTVTVCLFDTSPYRSLSRSCRGGDEALCVPNWPCQLSLPSSSLLPSYSNCSYSSHSDCNSHFYFYFLLLFLLFFG